MSNLKAPTLSLNHLLQAGAGALATLGLTALLWATASAVTIVDGSSQTRVRTHARRIEGALAEAALYLSGADRSLPVAGASLGDTRAVLIERGRIVQLDINGEQHSLLSAADDPSNLLAELGIRLLPGDQVWVDGVPWRPGEVLDDGPSRLRLEQGHAWTVRSAGQTLSVRAAGSTAVGVLRAAGLTLFEADQVDGGVGAEAADDTVVHRPSIPVTIASDGRRASGRTSSTKVGAALAAVGLSPQGLDQVSPGSTANIEDGEPIRIARVSEQLILELEPVPFETQYQPLADLEIDEKRILDTGAYGVRANQVRVRNQDGEEVERILEGNWLAREPEPRLVGYGTQIVIRTVSTADGSLEYWRAVDMWATSYSPSRAGVSPEAPNFGITASGKPLHTGLVAIDRSLIPFGTIMYVPGYGFAEAADTGSGVKGLWIDLGYDDDDYVPWASTVTVYFLTPVPPANSIVWILP